VRDIGRQRQYSIGEAARKRRTTDAVLRDSADGGWSPPDTAHAETDPSPGNDGRRRCRLAAARSYEPPVRARSNADVSTIRQISD
jgi:hypothetical protein